MRQPKSETSTSYREIRAKHTPETITVYQAYSPTIAIPALQAQALVSPFSRTRMTWIKPSFLWMAYHSGWASKANQEHFLAIEITRSGFEWALRHSCLSHYTPTPGDEIQREEWQAKMRASPVRVQWDPEWDLDLGFRALGHRSIQIGLSKEAVGMYLDEWIVSIADVTELMKEVEGLLRDGDVEGARARL
ncbi:hypothetical protein PENANT_c003G10090 [Penicillium antarcticum]|uniref:DUF4291 domain-containing protein n=1 Tax=Penicillium antarcticum TaxID=416450 RepID=A0A1V6QJL2_9EURO|nr:uncharacterized protein N7508_005969 [Penicillium antarcticum]KAJ5306954.1 hypothetical protein N7508_005969 [Penicillium antarcticum]OQD89066.1 hypothetical protein PENANT_c003G10090 [Penicillium antarcticum]